MGKVWEIDSYTCFFPLDSHHNMVYFITWEAHGFSHQISHSIVKPIEWGMPGKLVPILFR